MFNEEFIKQYKSKIIIFSAALVVLNFLVYGQIFSFESRSEDLKIYFFDVGQGDSELVILPGGVKVLIDGGPPNGKLLENLSEIFPAGERYIDLIMVSHPQLDHFGGLIEVLKRYQVGAFLWNGRDGENEAWNELKEILGKNSVQTVVLGEKDKVSYGESVLEILSPGEKFLGSKELNDTTLVAELSSKNSKTLFTGDIGFDVENFLIPKIFGTDILKVAHHGSKYSSGRSFLSAASPKIAVIEVGKNGYGHPTTEAINQLKNSGARIYRTDKNGTVELVINGESIRIFNENNVESK